MVIHILQSKDCFWSSGGNVRKRSEAVGRIQSCRRRQGLLGSMGWRRSRSHWGESWFGETPGTHPLLGEFQRNVHMGSSTVDLLLMASEGVTPPPERNIQSALCSTLSVSGFSSGTLWSTFCRSSIWKLLDLKKEDVYFRNKNKSKICTNIDYIGGKNSKHS